MTAYAKTNRANRNAIFQRSSEIAIFDNSAVPGGSGSGDNIRVCCRIVCSSSSLHMVEQGSCQVQLRGMGSLRS